MIMLDKVKLNTRLLIVRMHLECISLERFIKLIKSFKASASYLITQLQSKSE
jgi:hypothetical protein